MTDNSFWSGKRVWVTGGTGFLGRHLCARLGKFQCGAIHATGHRDYDLRDPDWLPSSCESVWARR